MPDYRFARLASLAVLSARLCLFSAFHGASAWALPPEGFPTDAPMVVERTASVTVLFPERVGVVLARSANGSISGVSELFVEERSILSATPPGNSSRAATLELISADAVGGVADWPAYLAERKALGGQWPRRGERTMELLDLGSSEYRGYRIEGNTVILETFISRGGVTGTVDWVFRPAEVSAGGDQYLGLGWQLVVGGMEQAAWLRVAEAVPTHDGDWTFAQTWGNWIENQTSVGTSFEVPRGWYFADYQPFYFSGGNGGAVVSYFDRPVGAEVEVVEDAGRHVIDLRIPLGEGSLRSTPMKYWLLTSASFQSKWSAIDAWTAFFDFLAIHYRSALGLGVTELVPTLEMRFPDERYMADYLANGPPALEASWWYRFAHDELALADELGYRVIRVVAWDSDAEHAPDEYLTGGEGFGSGNAPWRLEVSEAMGGETALAELVARAHERGIKIVLWTSPGHLSNSSPLLVDNPQWVTWRSYGVPEDADYADVTGVSLYSGYYDYALSRYQAIKSATAIDGFLVDSHLTFGVYPDFGRVQPSPQLAKTLATQRAWRDMGYSDVIIEGCGPLGLSSGGYPGYEDVAPNMPLEVQQEAWARIERFVGREYGLYRYVVDSVVEPQSYYRALASKGHVTATYLDLLAAMPEDQVGFIQQANLDYLRVMERMETRRLLGDARGWYGAEWTNGETAEVALFAFDRFEYSVGRGAVVEDVTAKTLSHPVKVLETVPWHTYIVSNRPACAPSPAVGCKEAGTGKSRLALKRRKNGADRYRAAWVWREGASTNVTDFGDPLKGMADYHFCLYDGSSNSQPLFDAIVASGGDCAGRDCWKPVGTVANPRGFTFKSPSARGGPVTRVRLKAGASGKSQVRFKARGLYAPELPLTGTVTMQLQIADGTTSGCWQTSYPGAVRNGADEFKAKGP
ncbi:MAG: hypothetical protein ACE5D3_00730 [Candidatus Binatia bacterium]